MQRIGNADGNQGILFLQTKRWSRRSASNAGPVKALGQESDRARRERFADQFRWQLSRGQGIGEEQSSPRLLDRDVPTENRRVACAEGSQHGRRSAGLVWIVHNRNEDLRRLTGWQPDAGARDRRALRRKR